MIRYSVIQEPTATDMCREVGKRVNEGWHIWRGPMLITGSWYVFLFFDDGKLHESMRDLTFYSEKARVVERVLGYAEQILRSKVMKDTIHVNNVGQILREQIDLEMRPHIEERQRRTPIS